MKKLPPDGEKMNADQMFICRMQSPQTCTEMSKLSAEIHWLYEAVIIAYVKARRMIIP